MSEKLVVVPELCSGCHICELACAFEHFGANNPKKSAIRIRTTYPDPAQNKPVVCSQCAEPDCAAACPTDALERIDGVVKLDEDKCIYCFDCVEACPFDAMYVHRDSVIPIKCDMCGGDPACARKCPKDAIAVVPSAAVGRFGVPDNVLSSAQVAEIGPRGER